MTKIIVGFTGGIDSQACADWCIENFGHDDVVLLNSDAGGNEDPVTTDHVKWYSENIHPVVMLSPIVADMAGRGKGMIALLGLKPTDPLTFELMGIIKQMWPSSQFQFCTEHMKLRPLRRWQDEAFGIGGIFEGEDFERYSGVRRDESQNRKNAPLRIWDDFFDCYLNQPLIHWSKKHCFDYVVEHSKEINPLYKLGFNRVGCAPCINSNKEDILSWYQRRPENLDKIRQWEKRVGKTFFKPVVPGMVINWVDDVIKWAQTSHGGRQFNMFRVLNNRPSCESKYGLCE